jgi:phosphoglycerol transferase MdoB-like AlkP superfamily enzyme
VLYHFEDGWQPIYKFQRTIYNDNSNIPFILYGNSVKNTRILRQIKGVDLAPTIMEILNMSVPDHCAGSILEEVLW